MKFEIMVEKILQSSFLVIQKLIRDKELIDTIDKVSKKIIACFKNGNKVLLCGNGGSAADAQHIAAELSGRFYLDRAPLPAEALHVNTSYITAVANDYSYDEIYSRYVHGMGNAGDILIGLSTSGNSKNIINAFIAAKEKKMETIALTGKSGGKLKEYASCLINIPSSDTPRIQEAHILVGHILCEIVEKELFG